MTGDGAAQRLSLGEPHTACELRSLGRQHDIEFRMAFLGSASRRDLVIMSSTGKVVELQVDYEE